MVLMMDHLLVTLKVLMLEPEMANLSALSLVGHLGFGMDYLLVNAKVPDLVSW